MMVFVQCLFVALMSGGGWGFLFATMFGPVVGWVFGGFMAVAVFTIFWVAERGPVSDVARMYNRRFDD